MQQENSCCIFIFSNPVLPIAHCFFKLPVFQSSLTPIFFNGLSSTFNEGLFDLA